MIIKDAEGRRAIIADKKKGPLSFSPLEMAVPWYHRLSITMHLPFINYYRNMYIYIYTHTSIVINISPPTANSVSSFNLALILHWTVVSGFLPALSLSPSVEYKGVDIPVSAR